MNRNFADVSSNQGTIDIPEYHAAGYRILAVKATEGTTYINPLHRGQALACGLKHMIVIHYHFARPDVGNTPRDEAVHFLRACQGLLGPRDYVALDVERAAPQGWNHDPAWAREWDKTVQEFTRFHTILYANKSTLQISDEWLVGNDKRVWDADWSTDANYAPKGYVCAFRQFSDGHFGPTPHNAIGIGECDMNRVADSKLWAAMVASQHG